MRCIVVAIVAIGCSTDRILPEAEPVTGIHPSGILDETSEAFHGKELARRGYDLALCAKCHGDDFAGGVAKSTCLTCHASGPDACETCHRGGPTSGVHLIHASAGEACGECHVVPTRWDDPGHVLDDPAPAEVTFGARAALTLAPADRAGPPAYVDGTCVNVYCHGDALHAGGGTAPQPRWDDPTPAGGCTTCHGAPPPSHVRSDCASCHGTAHINGVLDLGGGCNGCHGDAASPAPPRDLAGNQFTTAIGVGAHRAHLDGLARLRAPLACAECHRVPAAIGDAGHLDSLPPAEVVLASGAWDHAAATCAGECHGTSAPMWTAGSSQVFCGSCHGVPPTTPSHTPAMTIGDCATCHPRTVDAFGNIVFVGATSQHMDGDLDVN